MLHRLRSRSTAETGLGAEGWTGGGGGGSASPLLHTDVVVWGKGGWSRVRGVPQLQASSLAFLGGLRGRRGEWLVVQLSVRKWNG